MSASMGRGTPARGFGRLALALRAGRAAPSSSTGRRGNAALGTSTAAGGTYGRGLRAGRRLRGTDRGSGGAEAAPVSPPLRRLLRRARRRMRAAWLLRGVATLGPWVGALAVVLVLVDRFTMMTWGEPSAAAVAVAAGAGLCLVALVAPLPLRRVALVADRGLGAQDTLVASLEVGDRLDPLACAVRERARAITATARARRAVPLQPRWRNLALTAAIGLVAGGAAVATNPQDARRQRQAELRAELRAAADQLQTLADVSAAPSAAGAADPALAKELADLAKMVSQARDLESGLAALQRAEADLAAGLTADVLAKKTAAAGLERNVQMLPLRGFGNPNEPESAVTQFEKAARNAKAMTKEEMGVLANRLAQLAEGQRLANPAVAQAMNDASAALRSGDRAGAEAALDRAAQAQRDAAAAVSAAERRADAAGALAKPTADLQSAADRAAARDGGGANGRQGANGDGTGNGQPTNGPLGQGGGFSTRHVLNNEESGISSAPSTVTGSKGGTGAGLSAPAKAAGGSDDSQPQLPELGFDEANGKLEDFDRGAASDQVPVPGKADDSGESGPVVQRDQAPGPDGVSRVPLADRAATYQAQATAAMQRPDVPPAVRALVSRYFASLTDKKS